MKVAGSNCEGDPAKDHDYGLQSEVYRRHVYRKVIWAYHINRNKNTT